jgi:tetratricopeptide (TPR) repeat protein
MGSISELGRLFSASSKSVLVLCLMAAAAGPSNASSISARQVDLKLKIQPGAYERHEQYMVELRRTTGECIRMAYVMTGGNAHFKHLKPDIYLACVEGSDGSKRCQSVDMFPPPGSKNREFDAQVAMPLALLNSAGNHTVRVDELEIPKEARKELVRSYKAVLQGDSSDTLAHLQRALALDPDCLSALNSLGAYYYFKGDQALSIRYFTKVTELDPDYPSGWANLAGSLLAGSRWEEALAASQHGLALQPDDLDNNAQAAFCYYFMHRYPEARKYFEKVLELDPASGTFPMLYLARIALVENRKEDAEAYARMFLKLHPNYPDVPAYLEALRDMAGGDVQKEPVIALHNPRQQ